ncbi:MAG: HupE/UreJ family protein [Candidatus Peribacteraceae bacterium]|nr:HupE/UreJ family protein [Candidatus Peribacteraceae bacterium]
MSRSVTVSGFFIFLLGAFATAAPVRAHELLPQALLEYVQQHPEATADDLQKFIESDPALSGNDTAQQQKLIALARDPDGAGFFHTVWQFLILGIEHILSGPDHVLFVFSLLLTFVSVRKTAWLLSCFTLSHSVTLILAGGNILRVSSAIVEPVIALSIAYVALTTVFLAPRWPFFADSKARAFTVLCFGFFHGMGFAGALQDVAVPGGILRFLSSLLSFNLGVDVGQMLIVVIALPLIFFARRKRWHRRATQVAAGLISVLAMVWFVQRVVYPA